VTDMLDLTAHELRRLIGAKAISPVELLEASIARIEALNPVVNAVVATCYDRARTEAKAAERRVMDGEALPTLHGLPVTIKDLNDTEGLRTTYGSRAFADHVPDADERSVARLRQAGAIVIGKSNSPEFGAGINTTNGVYGATRNPFDTDRICGGSSGGAAVALATGMNPIAHGSDTGGSLRIPAAYCGIVGFRPTPGLIPVEDKLCGWNPLSVQGPMARNAADAALMLSGMAAHDPDDPLSGPVDAAGFAALPEVDLAGLRVAFSDDMGFVPVEPEMKAAFRAKAAEFMQVFRSAEWRDPPLPDVKRIYEVQRVVNAVVAYRELIETKGDLISPNLKGNVETGLKLTLEDQAKAHAGQTRLYRAMNGFFREVDLLISPTMAFPPFAVEENFRAGAAGKPLKTYFDGVGLTYSMTVAAVPSISIPCGLDPTGAPFGIQIAAAPRADRFLLAASSALERVLATNPALARPVPDIAALIRRKAA